jgi:hypothetical protein
MRQLAKQNEATQVAAKKAAEFDPNARKDTQQQIADQMTGQLQQQVAQPQITAQGVQVGTTIPQGQGGTEYLTAQAKEAAKSTASLRALAGLMGRIGSASELRRNEALGMGDAAGEIGRIQNGANTMGAIDQIGVQNAGRENPLYGVASGVLRGYGMSAAGGAGTKYPDNNTASGPTGAWLSS